MMKFKALGTFVFVLVALCGPSVLAREFQHPSILSTQANLARLKERVKSDPVIKLGYEQFLKSRFVDLERPHAPYAVVKVVASGTCDEEKAFRDDSQAAHANALMWVITGDTRYRDKSMTILNDWAKTYEKIVSSDPAHSYQVRLECAWAVPVWLAAADIIRFYDNGKAEWKPNEIATFDRFISSMLATARECRNNNNNWGTSATLTMMAAAVYQDDEVAYNEAIALHKKHLASISKQNGALGPDYLRDPWHPQYTVLTWIQICEIAWNQGDDLYSITLDKQSTPRLALVLEHFAKLFTGALPNPKGLKKGDYKGSHIKKQGYDMACNHFVNRMSMGDKMPTFAAMVPLWRPGGIDSHFIAWDTLTHAELNAGK